MAKLMSRVINSILVLNYINFNGLYVILISLIIVYVYIYCRRRYFSPLASAPLAPANHFLIKYFGMVPPPNDVEKTDSLSRFLILAGQDPSLSPISVCWSIIGTPLVLVNTLRGVKDVLIDGQAKSKIKGEPPKIQRGNLIRLIQNLVFGGKSINNAVGEVSLSPSLNIEWRWRRHILLPPFQPKQLVPKLLPYVATRTGDLLQLFEKHAHSGKAIELDELFMGLTMDVINYYLYGRSELNYDIVGGRQNLKNEHHRLGLGFQSVEAWLPFGINKTNWAQRRYKPARDKLKEFIRDSLNYALEDYTEDLKNYEKQGVSKNQRSYRSVAACAFDSGSYKEDHIDLINDLLSLTFAGYDTTAHTLSFAFSELARNPKLQDELFHQVRSVLGPPPVAPETITAEKLAKMPLVTAIYRETLRKYPAVVFIPVHVNKDVIVDGVVVPSNAEIWCNVRGIQMNPAIFPDPEKFDPTRWLKPQDKVKLTENNDNEVPQQDNVFDNLNSSSSDDNNRTDSFITPEAQYNFPDLSFTLGQHACLGKNLAILELRTVIACVMNQFTCKLKEGLVIDTKVVLTTKPRYGVWVHFEQR
ncbi:cytochrome P450 [Cokeromyces recurvatus]|uniref:cytochrome P450 n=1 Tax=Cokeromyces recurvatus TaxID=90255 RepID=UPI002220AAF6|nr:cytochrome P450 [Cokeromyces recurvatus]KAI7907735.1 cytochrome P450 [Cokeromyces recurvatus]